MFKTAVLMLWFGVINLCAQIDEESLNRLKIDAMVVKELNTQSVLYSKEAEKIIKPASLTKIMTALLAIEYGNFDDNVTITSEMISVEPTKAGYKVGEVILLGDLVKATMIESDNDAAMAVAIAIGGDIDTFVAMMNFKAHRLGMEHTQFMNPSGLDHPEHFSTAGDLLVLAEYAIKNPVFNQISLQNGHIYSSVGENPRRFVAKTHNRLLGKYTYAVGIKTGYTSKAGPCFIARAKKNGQDCVIVMLNSKENRWKTAEQIFEKVLNTEVATNTTLQEPA